ncbi:MAG: BatA domain-containing protein [Candidatus Nanohalobium sp.]
MLQQVIQQLSNYFLSPVGLAALIGIVPLLIFYLMRPSPEEKIMPSMKFFQKDKKSGRLQKALQILQRNTMLLLHILMIAGLAAAIANPYIMQEERPENAVIVIDNSASMKPAFEQVKEKAVSELGRSNTVIVANDEVNVLLEKASFSKARKTIQGLAVEETGTDIVGAVSEARNYPGKIFVASDMDQTKKTEKDIQQLLETISTSRPLDIFTPEKTNSWGIVNLEISEDNATAFIQNYRNEKVETSFEVGKDSRKITLKPKELRKISFTLEKGENTLSLGRDGFKVDNKAFVLKKTEGATAVTVIGDERNRYLMKAFELMENVNATYRKPSQELGEADVYVIGNTDSLKQISAQTLSEKLKSGKGLVVYAQEDLADLGLDNFPVSSVGSLYNSTVSVQRPVSLQLDNISLHRAEVGGSSAATPSEALKFFEYGGGEVAFYNLASPEFRRDIMYPVFWKKMVEEVSGEASISEVNRKSGSTVLTEKKAVELSEIGFVEIEGAEYSSNLLDSEESSFQDFEGEAYNSSQTVKNPRSVRSLPVLAVMLFGLLEVFYLYRTGEIP